MMEYGSALKAETAKKQEVHENLRSSFKDKQ